MGKKKKKKKKEDGVPPNVMRWKDIIDCRERSSRASEKNHPKRDKTIKPEEWD